MLFKKILKELWKDKKFWILAFACCVALFIMGIFEMFSKKRRKQYI